FASLETGPVTDDSGTYVGAIASIVDITERRRGELELVSAQERLKELHRLAHIGTFHRDIETDQMTWSEELYHIAGRDPSLPSPTFPEMSRFFTPASWDILNNGLTDALATKDPLNLELEMVRADGSIRWVHAHIAGTFDTQGKMKGLHGTVHDDTEQKLAKQALFEANKKVRLLTSITRHDILNQLSCLRVLHDLALQTADMDTVNTCISQAILVDIQIESIISFTREYENFGILSSSWQRVFPHIESAQNQVTLGEVRVLNRIPDALEIYADPIIKALFPALMENAIRHGGNVTTIRFSCFECGNSLIITVEDDGIGIPEEEKVDIFNQGYGKHTGIGLFIVREILAITGLSIRECGIEGEGAKFEISVPAGKYCFLQGTKRVGEACQIYGVDDVQVLSDIAFREEENIDSEGKRSKKNRISLLVIDDEPFLLEAIQQYLEQMCEFEVTTKASAKEAINTLGENKFDAIVSDFDMPGMNGLELLKYLKANGDTTPFILLTGKGREEVVIEALNAGADFYIQKGGEPGVVYPDLENKIGFAVSQRRNEKKIRQNAFILERRNRELEKARTELTHLNQVLESRVIDRVKEVESLLHHKDLFIEMMGHDLKTPLTPICALLPQLLKEEENPESREIISMLIKDAAFMRNLIEKVLVLARLNPGVPQGELKDIVVRSIVDQAIWNFLYSAQEKSLKIHNQVSDDLTFLMNALHLEIIIRNLLENAIKYSNRGGVITISAMSDEVRNTFSISDTGQGMSPEERAHIFDEFYQADNSRHERGSHGLGLSIVKRIVDLYLGTIHAESSGKGKGSTVIIRLPKNPD
ncbi:MAG: ATP-binding protein, partial [Methanobacteriota archaeon]